MLGKYTDSDDENFLDWEEDDTTDLSLSKHNSSPFEIANDQLPDESSKTGQEEDALLSMITPIATNLCSGKLKNTFWKDAFKSLLNDDRL